MQTSAIHKKSEFGKTYMCQINVCFSLFCITNEPNIQMSIAKQRSGATCSAHVSPRGLSISRLTNLVDSSLRPRAETRFAR